MHVCVYVCVLVCVLVCETDRLLSEGQFTDSADCVDGKLKRVSDGVSLASLQQRRSDKPTPLLVCLFAEYFFNDGPVGQIENPSAVTVA